MTHAIGIVAHQKREHQADRLAQQTQPAFISIDTGAMGANTNHLWAWKELTQYDTTWSVVLEDDATPIPDFPHHLTNMLDAVPAPTPIVSAYLGKMRPPNWQARIKDAIEKADANEAHWIVGTHLLHAVATCIRTELVNDMLDNMVGYLPIDQNITRWARRHNHRVAYTWPSLVDHADIPTLISHADKAERTPGRVAHRVGTHTTWNSRAVEL